MGGEEVQVEAGSMVSMSTGVQIQTKARGGLIKSLARSVLGGESFFQKTSPIAFYPILIDTTLVS
ncbi:hypothetical protein GF348_02930 [candidate division KSB3 bacterium]|nr:hypothetical protein [candidate division KSB3 bacterium]